MKKLSLFVCFLSAFLVLNACDYEESTLSTNIDEPKQQSEEKKEKEEKQDDEMKGENEQTEKNEKEQEKQEVKKEKPKRIKKKFDVGEQLQFKQFDVEIERMKVYTKKGKILADIKLIWRNKAHDYGSDKMTFFVATQMQVKQGETELIEINDAWNPENKNSSDVFFPNALGGTWKVELTYELIDAETPIDIIFTPTTETEDSKTVTIEIPE